MTDYIERDAALSHPFANGRYDHEHADEKYISGHESYREWLEQLPAADVRPVVRGRWVDEPDSIRMCTCSLCGQWITKELSDCFNYCPTCGAYMNVKPSETLVGYIPIAEETEDET